MLELLEPLGFAASAAVFILWLLAFILLPCAALAATLIRLVMRSRQPAS